MIPVIPQFYQVPDMIHSITGGIGNRNPGPLKQLRISQGIPLAHSLPVHQGIVGIVILIISLSVIFIGAGKYQIVMKGKGFFHIIHLAVDRFQRFVYSRLVPGRRCFIILFQILRDHLYDSPRLVIVISICTGHIKQAWIVIDDSAIYGF